MVSQRPKVLIPEKLSEDGITMLQKTLEVDIQIGLTPSALIEIIPNYEALIVRSATQVTADLLKAGTKLKVVARAGVGVDNVDVDAATQMGIIVVNSPSGNIQAAAEHTIALLLATARHVSAGSSSLKAGKWIRSKLVGVETKGKTLGIVGLGKVGVLVARMAIGLGLTIVAYDPYASPDLAKSHSVTLLPSLHDLCRTIDFLTIHTPLMASTKGLIGAKELALMKPTVRVLNVARGGVIDEDALVEALEKGTIAGAGIDVFTSEPPEEGSSAHRLVQCEKAVVTPHLGASTVEAQENVSLDVCAQVLLILSGKLPTSAVNAPLILPEEYSKLQPFVLLVEKLGSLYTQHFTPSHSSQHTPTFELVYDGELSGISNTRPLFAALVKGLTSSFSDRKGRDVNIVNAPMIAKERGIIINESHSRDPSEHTYSSLVTLRGKGGPGTEDEIISGYVSPSQIFISRLGRFTTSFVPSGTLLILHNYDSPGKIGSVGSVLGKAGVNIAFMNVAPLSQNKGEEKVNEALMILGVDREVESSVSERLGKEEGILSVSLVTL